MAEYTHQHGAGSCRALLESLSLYVDGEAGEALCQEIERHMAECENCRIVIDTLNQTVRLYREHGHANLPGEAKRRLFVALDIAQFLKEEG